MYVKIHYLQNYWTRSPSAKSGRMLTVISPIVILISFALFAGTGAEATVITAAHNTTVNLMCIDLVDQLFPPAWVMNGSLLIADDGYRASRDEDTGELIGILTINGNHTCGTFNVYCLLRNGQIMHDITLTVEGRLPFPENIRINEQNDNLLINWDPPYSQINTNSRIINVDPHITQYTVYIVDNYTGYYTDKVNVTGTSFGRIISDDNSSCPMYRVTAWNSGGEGDMSVPLPGYLPRIPNSIAADQLAAIQTGNGALHICSNVTETCTVRMPNYFLVTVTSTDGVIITAVQQPVAATIHVALPQNVDECLIVNISAGNSAGMSSPTEVFTVGCQTTGSSTDPTTTTTTSTGSDTSSTDLVDQTQQGDNNIIYIATAVGAVVMVTAVALLLIILWRCKRPSKVEKDEVVMHYNQAYETVTRIKHSGPAAKVPTEPCPAYGVVGSYHE